MAVMPRTLSRTVEGWMNEELYRKLGDDPDIEIAWNLLRGVIGHHMFSSEYVTVPFFESAVYYNQMFVFKKKQNWKSCLGLASPTYQTVGHLDYLVDRDASTWTPQFDYSPWDVTDGLSLYREYRLSVSSNSGQSKSVDVIVRGAHARRAPPPPGSGALKIHTHLLQELVGVRTLYVIHEVVFASCARITVRIGQRDKTAAYNTDTPIAFKYRKYSVDSRGHFGRERFSSLKTEDRSATWLQPTPQPVPWWNAHIRRPLATRKVRSVLTLPGEDMQRRAQWAHEGGPPHGTIGINSTVENQDEDWQERMRNIRRSATLVNQTD